MRYFSDVTKRFYTTEKELLSDEQKVAEAEAKKQQEEKAKKLERTTRAKAVEAALADSAKAQEKATKLLKEFTKDYGYYHMSLFPKEDKNTDTTSSIAEAVGDFMYLANLFLKN